MRDEDREETRRGEGDKESEGKEGKDQRLELSASQVLAAGAATLVAAVAASFLGVYGTIIGAAMMSVLSTSGTAVGQHLLRRSGHRARGLVANAGRLGSRGGAQEPGARSTAVGEPEAPGTARDRDPAKSATEGAAAGDRASQRLTSAGMEAAGPAGERSVGFSRGWWRTALLLAATTFLVVMALITVFEVLAGRSLSDTVRGETASSGPSLFGGETGTSTEPEYLLPEPEPDGDDPFPEDGGEPTGWTEQPGPQSPAPQEEPTVPPAPDGGSGEGLTEAPDAPETSDEVPEDGGGEFVEPERE